MSENAMRFAVRNSTNHRAATWKCWQPNARSNDVYLACRALKGQLKASFHESGQCHISYSPQFFQNGFPQENCPSSRFIDKWPRATTISSGVSLLFRIRVPWFSPTVPIIDDELDKDMMWIDSAPNGKGNEFIIVAISSDRSPPDLPGMKCELLGEIKLEREETVGLFHRLVDITIPDPIHRAPNYFRGCDKSDLKEEGLRALYFQGESDGHRVIYDVPVKIKVISADRSERF